MEQLEWKITMIGEHEHIEQSRLIDASPKMYGTYNSRGTYNTLYEPLKCDLFYKRQLTM